MKIEFDSTEVKSREVKSNKDGKVYTFYEQAAWAHFENEKYPVSIRVSLESNNPYKPGFYSVALGSFKANKFGQLELKRFLVLKQL